jgi:ferredoxin
MTDQPTNPDPIHDILAVLDRHGYTRASNEHTVPDTVVLSASQVKTIIAALDEASLYKRDRAETCADCADQSCGTCRWRLEAAEDYDSLAAHLIETRQASRTPTASRPGPVSQPQPAADREAGQ